MARLAARSLVVLLGLATLMTASCVSGTVIGVARSLFAPAWGTQLYYQLFAENNNATPCYSSHVPGTYYGGPSYPYNSGPNFVCASDINQVLVSGGPAANSSCALNVRGMQQSGRKLNIVQAFMLGVDGVTGEYCMNAEANSFGGNLPVTAAPTCDRCDPSRVDASSAQLNSSAVFWNFGQYMNGVLFNVAASTDSRPNCIAASVWGGVSHFTEFQCADPVTTYNVTVNGNPKIRPCIISVSPATPHTLAAAIGLKGQATNDTSVICANAAFAQIGNAKITFNEGCGVCHSDDVQH